MFISGEAFSELVRPREIGGGRFLKIYPTTVSLFKAPSSELFCLGRKLEGSRGLSHDISGSVSHHSSKQRVDSPHPLRQHLMYPEDGPEFEM